MSWCGLRWLQGKVARKNGDSDRFRAARSVAGLLLLFGVLASGGCAQSGTSLPAGLTPTIITTSAGIKMVLIPAGTFEMGSIHEKEDEAPPHTVMIDAFLMDRTEVTQEQFARLEMADPSHFKNPKNPVEQINWPQAILFCNRRSEAEGFQPCYNEVTLECSYQASGYRLPTEAEWEYACRAGSTTTYSFGNDSRSLGEHAWFAENSFRKTHSVAQKRPNPWGLFDMHGNVAEWCNDVYAKDYYKRGPLNNPRGPEEGQLFVLRGGGWASGPEQLRSSARLGETPGFGDACLARDAIGFRCVRKPPADLSGSGKES
jgi:formylglycine-generating enzyme required for sulfatase activity